MILISFKTTAQESLKWFLDIGKWQASRQKGWKTGKQAIVKWRMTNMPGSERCRYTLSRKGDKGKQSKHTYIKKQIKKTREWSKQRQNVASSEGIAMNVDGYLYLKSWKTVIMARTWNCHELHQPPNSTRMASKQARQTDRRTDSIDNEQMKIKGEIIMIVLIYRFLYLYSDDYKNSIAAEF